MLGKSLQCEAKKTIRNGDFNCENIENKNEYNKLNSYSMSRVSYFVKIPIFNLILNSFKIYFNYRDISVNEMLSLYVHRKQVFSYCKSASAFPSIASSQLSITNRTRIRIRQNSSIECKFTYSNSKSLKIIKNLLHALLEDLKPRVIIPLLINSISICVTNPVDNPVKNLTPPNVSPVYINLTNDAAIIFHNTRYRASYTDQTHYHVRSYRGSQLRRQR